jgi:hypothetical protein
MSEIQIGFAMLFWLFTVMVFYTMGVNTGYVQGRKAVRAYYEQREKVRG